MPCDKDHVERAKRGFETSFSQREFYQRQTQDDQHLKLIKKMINLSGKMKLLDLGTGLGYVAFSIAASHPDVNVIGLDIVERVINKNRAYAEKNNISNVSFCHYDGMTFPFSDGAFDGVMTRYVLHHFLDINKAFSEMSRVLKPGGHLFISDPTPNDKDVDRFVDAFMQMKPDGHVTFYKLQEFIGYAKAFGLRYKSNCDTIIRFPRKNVQAYKPLLNKHKRDITSGYQTDVVGDEIFITLNVLNIMFEKE